jgi:hypothetical protein
VRSIGGACWIDWPRRAVVAVKVTGEQRAEFVIRHPHIAPG